MAKSKKQPPAPAPTDTPETYRARFIAHLPPASIDQLTKWQDDARTSPQQPSNGVMIERLISFAILRGFNPQYDPKAKK